MALLVLAGEHAAGEFFEDAAVVGDHHNGRSRSVEIPQKKEDFVGSFTVQIARGFIGQNNGRLVEEGARNGDALLLAAGELVRHLVRLGGHAHGLQHFHDAGVNGAALLPAGGAEHKLQVGLYGAVLQQLEILEHHPHGTAEVGDVPALDIHKVIPTGRGLTLEDAVFCGDGSDDRRFAGAYLSHDVHEVPGLHVHVERVNDYVFSVKNVGFLEVNERLLHG